MKNILKRLPKKLLVAVSLVAVAFSAGVAVEAWYPDRPTFTIESPAPYVTFNSITNNADYGDERMFFDAKNAANTNSGGFADSNTVQDGEEMLLRVYVHNNAADNLNTVPDGNGGYKGIAENTKVRIHLPSATDQALRANAYISADNAQPTEVSDTVDFASAGKFALEYVPGSAMIYTNAVPSGMNLSDSIVTTGAPIGYDQLNGTVPGCFKYSSYVTIKVKVKKPSIDIQKSVRLLGTTEWKQEVTANKGDTVEYLLRVENTGPVQLENVLVGDNLPPYLTYVQDSTKLKDSNFPSGTPVTSNNITTGGIDIGSLGVTGVSYVWFRADVATEMPEACGVVTLTNVGVATSRDTTVVEDNALLTVDSGKPCVGPTFACEDLKVDLLGGRKVRATVKPAMSGEGVTAKLVEINYGDGKTPKTTNNKVNGNFVDEYEYVADGTYKITASVMFTVNGEDQPLKTSEGCVEMVTLTTTTPPTTPPVLPNTGAGSVIGLFAATTAAGAAIHNVVSRRRA